MKKILLVMVAGMSLAAFGPVQQGGGDPEYERVRQKVETMRLTVGFQDASLMEVVAYLRDASGLNIVVDPSVGEMFSEEDLQVTLKVKDLLLKSVLKLILNGRDLSAIYREGVLVILPRDQVKQHVVTRIYDVRDMLHALKDFPGPTVELVYDEQGGNGPLVGAAFTLEDNDPLVDENFIEQIILQMTGGGSWDDNPNANMSFVNGLLIVTQNVKTHREINHLLNMLRQFR